MTTKFTFTLNYYDTVKMEHNNINGTQTAKPFTSTYNKDNAQT